MEQVLIGCLTTGTTEMVFNVATLRTLVIGILILFGLASYVISEQINPNISTQVALIVGVLLLLVIAGYVIFQQPCWPARLKLSFEIFLVVGFGAIIAILQIKHSQRIANRQEYTSAVEHLSSASPAVRLKGVRDLYERAKVTNDKKIKDEIWKILQGQVKYFTRGKNYRDEFKDKPSADIQEIIYILARMGKYKESKAFDYGTSNTRIDLSGAYLVGAYFFEAQLQGARFESTKLQGARFEDAQLQGAYFESAHLQGVNFESAQLQGAYLVKAQLQGARFGSTKLQGADFRYAELQGADFIEAQLQGAIFWLSELQGAFSSKPSNKIFMPTFESVINARVEEDADMRNAIVEGGLTQESIDKIEKDFALSADYWGEWHKKRLKELLSKLKSNHTGGEVYSLNKHFEYQKAKLGKYVQKEADEWIEKFNKMMGQERNALQRENERIIKTCNRIREMTKKPQEEKR